MTINTKTRPPAPTVKKPHDEIAIAGVNFIGGRLVCGLYLQGEVSFWEPPTRTTTSVHRSHHRCSQRGIQGLEVMILQPMSYSTMQLPIFFQRFRCILDWFCGMSNVLGLVVEFGIRTSLWLRRSREAIAEEDDARI